MTTPPPRPTLTRIGRYAIRERIGKGAMGLVYSARDEVLDRQVALKVLMADLESDPDIRERFFREARLAAQLQHRNIVTVLDLGEEDGRLFIVMELLLGMTLGKFLDTTPSVSLEQKLDLMTQVCEGLGVAHRRGVFHRDVKPGNLFVQNDGTLKLLDFGIARMASSALTSTGLLLGTPDYMAPEQARGEEVDQRSDVFSAAAVFYLMLSGRKPFDAPDLTGVLYRVEHKDPLPLREDEAPAELSRIIFKALAKKPDDRYPRMADVLIDLIKFRRRFDGETRRRILAAAAALTEIRARLAERAALHEELQLDAAEPEPDPLAQWRDQYPQLAERGPDALASLPLRRRQADEIAAAIEATRTSLARELERLAEARRECAAGLEHEAENPRAALACFARALQACPGSTVASAHEQRCRDVVTELQSLEERLEACRVEAAAAIARRDWLSAIAVADSGLALHAGAHMLRQLRAVAEQRRDEAERQARDETAALLRRIDAAMADGRLAEAREGLAELEPRVAADELVGTRDRLRDLEARAAAAAAVRTEGEAVRLHARQLFDAGSHDAAVTRVREFAEAHPEDLDARRALELLSAEAERLARAARRRAEAAELAAVAAEQWDRLDAEPALRTAEAALAIEEDNATARRVAVAARAHLRAAADRAERLRRAQQHVAEGRRRLAQRRWAAAAREGERALALDAGADGAAQLIADVRQAEAEAEASRAAAIAAARRARAAAPIISNARAALRAGDSARARWAAESALAIDPTNELAQSLLTAALASAGAAPAGDGGGPTSDDTLAIAIDASMTHRLLRGATQISAAVTAAILAARNHTQSWIDRARKNE